MSEREEEIEFQESQLMLQNAMNKFEKNKPIPTGYCHWCEEVTPNPEDIFCCVECGEDQAKWKKANFRI